MNRTELRKKLNKIDCENYNKYDLVNLFESVRLSNEDLNKLSRIVNNEKAVYNFLNEKAYPSVVFAKSDIVKSPKKLEESKKATKREKSLTEGFNVDKDAEERIRNSDIDFTLTKDYDGNDFLIFDSWEDIQALEYEIDPDFEPRDRWDTSVLDNAFDGKYGFSDEYAVCDMCGKVIQTSPDSYSWTPDFFADYDGGYMVCGDCVRESPEDYLNSIINNPNNANTILDRGTLRAEGFELVEDDYENGWYDRSDSPEEILKNAREEHPEAEFIFSISAQEQFRTNFELWGRGLNKTLGEGANSMSSAVERQTLGYKKTKGQIQCNGGEQAKEVEDLLKAKYDNVTTQKGKGGKVIIKFSKNESLGEDFYDDEYDDFELASIYGGDFTYCPICGARMEYEEDGDHYCPKCKKSGHTLSLIRRGLIKGDNESLSEDVAGFVKPEDIGWEDITVIDKKRSRYGMDIYLIRAKMPNAKYDMWFITHIPSLKGRYQMYTNKADAIDAFNKVPLGEGYEEDNKYVVFGYDKDNDVYEPLDSFDSKEEAIEYAKKVDVDLRKDKVRSKETGEPFDWLVIDYNDMSDVYYNGKIVSNESLSESNSSTIDEIISQFKSSVSDGLFDEETISSMVDDMKKAKSSDDAFDIGNIYTNLNFFRFKDNDEIVRSSKRMGDKDVYFDRELAKPYIEKHQKNESLSEENKLDESTEISYYPCDVNATDMQKRDRVGSKCSSLDEAIVQAVIWGYSDIMTEIEHGLLDVDTEIISLEEAKQRAKMKVSDVKLFDDAFDAKKFVYEHPNMGYVWSVGSAYGKPIAFRFEQDFGESLSEAYKLRVRFKDKKTNQIYTRDYPYNGETDRKSINWLKDSDKIAFGNCKPNEDVMGYSLVKVGEDESLSEEINNNEYFNQETKRIISKIAKTIFDEFDLADYNREDDRKGQLDNRLQWQEDPSGGFYLDDEIKGWIQDNYDNAFNCLSEQEMELIENEAKVSEVRNKNALQGGTAYFWDCFDSAIIDEVLNMTQQKPTTTEDGKTVDKVTEDTVKQGSQWVNKGREGTHGKFKTKKEADAQRKAMFARGFKEGVEDDITYIELKKLYPHHKFYFIGDRLPELHEKIKSYKETIRGGQAAIIVKLYEQFEVDEYEEQLKEESAKDTMKSVVAKWRSRRSNKDESVEDDSSKAKKNNKNIAGIEHL